MSTIGRGLTAILWAICFRRIFVERGANSAILCGKRPMLTKTETQTKPQTQTTAFCNLIQFVEGLEKMINTQWGVQRIIQRMITELQIGFVDIR